MEKSLEKKNKLDFTTVSPLDVVFAMRHLSIMLKVGIDLSDALSALIRLSQKPKLKKIYTQIAADVSAGISLAVSLSKFPKVFKRIVITIIEVGEQSGNLELNLKYLADFLKKEYELERKLKGALMYPVAILGITVVEMLGVLFFILPQLQTLFESFPEKPEATVAILNGAAFIRDNFIIILVVLAVIFILIKLFLRTKKGLYFKDYLALHFPVISRLNKNNIYANYTRTLSILLRTGIPLAKSIKIAGSTVMNSIYRNIIEEKIYESFKAGKELATALREFPEYFPESLLVLVESGEKSGTLIENLEFAHSFFQEEAEDIINNLTSLLEPIMLVFIGGMVGGLAMIVILPMYQLLGSI